MAHLLINDLTQAIMALKLLERYPDLAPEEGDELIRQAVAGMTAATDHVRRFQQVRRVATKDTSSGPTLDLERSIDPLV